MEESASSGDSESSDASREGGAEVTARSKAASTCAVDMGDGTRTKSYGCDGSGTSCMASSWEPFAAQKKGHKMTIIMCKDCTSFVEIVARTGQLFRGTLESDVFLIDRILCTKVDIVQ